MVLVLLPYSKYTAFCAPLGAFTSQNLHVFWNLKYDIWYLLEVLVEAFQFLVPMRYTQEIIYVPWYNSLNCCKRRPLNPRYVFQSRWFSATNIPSMAQFCLITPSSWKTEIGSLWFAFSLRQCLQTPRKSGFQNSDHSRNELPEDSHNRRKAPVPGFQHLLIGNGECLHPLKKPVAVEVYRKAYSWNGHH